MFVSRSSSTTNFIRRLFWRIWFSCAGRLSLLAALGTHSMFLPRGLPKHICSGSYVTKYSKQRGDAWADTDSQISPRHPGLGNKTAPREPTASRALGAELLTFSKIWSSAYDCHHADAGTRSSAVSSLTSGWTSTSLHHLSSWPFLISCLRLHSDVQLS